MSDQNNPFPDTKYKQHEFAKADMSGTKFNGVDLSNAHFWAVLKRAKFIDCNLESCIFNDVNLSDSSYENINFSQSTFNNMNMSGVTFSNLNLTNAEIRDANMEGMKINGVLVSDLFNAYEQSN